jgi:hypothetical protein
MAGEEVPSQEPQKCETPGQEERTQQHNNKREERREERRDVP